MKDLCFFEETFEQFVFKIETGKDQGRWLRLWCRRESQCAGHQARGWYHGFGIIRPWQGGLNVVGKSQPHSTIWN
jgi:hypothetical protein